MLPWLHQKSSVHQPLQEFSTRQVIHVCLLAQGAEALRGGFRWLWGVDRWNLSWLGSGEKAKHDVKFWLGNEYEMWVKG